MSDSSEELDLLAAEYVLGVLDAATTHDVARRMQVEPTLAASVAAWEQRLNPLVGLVSPVTPPDGLWDRLAVSLGPGAGTPQPGILLRAWRSIVVWRIATAAGLAAAAAFAALFWLRPLPPQLVAALVPAGSASAAYVAEFEPNGTLRVTALRSISVASGKSLELWALSKGATRPVPLGLLPEGGRSVAPPAAPVRGTQLLISLEPQGGSPTGLPTGPVLFAGTFPGAD